MTPPNPKKVFILKTGDDLKAALRRLLAEIYADEKPWTKTRGVIIKPNAVNFEPYVYVEPAVIGALVSILKDDGVKHVTVAESCTNGSFTRLVFDITGIGKAVKAAGGKCVYLDEGNQAQIDMGSMGKVPISRFLADTLLLNRDEYFYINLAKLKTHSMTTVTLCLKNQWGFVSPKERGRLHNDFLHESIREVYRVFVPDLCLIEGLIATNHGHFPLKGFEDQNLWQAGILIGGLNAVAVDSAACRLVQIDPTSVKHIKLSAAEDDLLDPEVVYLNLVDAPPWPFTAELLPYFPSDVVVHKGKERCCIEGCWSNPMCTVQVLGANYGGHGGFHMFLGKGHNVDEVDSCKGPALVVGPCAQEEVYDRLLNRLGKKKVFLSPGHNNLKKTIRLLMQLMGVNVFNASPIPLYKFVGIYIKHLLSGSKADIGFF